jgi:tryptophan synthase alpha chain
MSHIAQAFALPRRVALIGYVTVGYPSLEATSKAVNVLEESGCDMVELGIPFSDPLADGVTIQRASQRALEAGVTLTVCLEMAAKLRQQVSLPLLFMTYYNAVLSFGLESFCRASAKAGVDGLIVPDLPPEEGQALEEASAAEGLDLVYLLAPNSTPERITVVGQHSRGFIYLVSITGVTGPRKSLPAGLGDFVTRVKRYVNQPLCIGFGVASPEQAKRLASMANGVIVGSRLVELIEEDSSLESLRGFVASLRKALDRG